MRRGGTTRIETSEADSDPELERRLLESRARQRQGLLDRERGVELLAAACLLAVAGAMALAIDSDRAFDPVLATALIAAYALSTRVEFHTGVGWTVPTELVFVPMLFLLPAAAVPLCVGAALVLAKLPEYLSGAVRADRAIVGIADAWYAVGPALVLSAAGVGDPQWSEWHLYVAALASQFVFDLATSSTRVVIGLGVPLRPLLTELRGIYVVDALLAPIGLLAAFASAEQQSAFLLVLPLVALIAIFARERDARIENALTLSAAYRGTAHLLGEVLSASHEYTGRHSRSVVVLARRVGEGLGLDERTLRDIEFGALLHDVGKLSVPNEILNKPGPLSSDEMALVREHTHHGQDMLERIGGVLREVGDVVRSHHEHYDGSGYPDGLAGDEIPMASRVIAVCDAFNAMTTDRPYRDAMSVASAVAELRATAGTQFDPNIVEAVIALVSTWGDEGAGPRIDEPVLATVAAPS